MTYPPNPPYPGGPQQPGQNQGGSFQPGQSGYGAGQPGYGPTPGAGGQYGAPQTPGQYGAPVGNPGAQNSYGQHPYGQSPYGQSPGQSPYGVGGFPGGGYPGGLPPAPKKSLTWLWITLGSLVVLVIAAIGALVIASSNDDKGSTTASASSTTVAPNSGTTTGPSTTTTTPSYDTGAVRTTSDVMVNDCVTVSKPGGPTSDKVDIRKSSCTSGFAFVVADKVNTADECGKIYGRLWFESDLTGTASPGALCVMPNYTVGKCYWEPNADVTDSSLADYREGPCGVPTGDPRLSSYKVESKVAGEPQCPAGQGKDFYPKPTPTGICFSKQ